ncbi:MAG TPA: LysR family transcriptional regulator [Herpetosiphon sp.]|uniref:Transcriptional regulator, LysR family n=1 Tax=Herpetosiphon aurantiacus (strain ATCC 23779 / DSM 785 / 114-95) TaxID=316274 RepID=A9B4C8_HERA2|nr:LysR substrate-binding domain-containing protein [Herpetosiphon sp.]ABX02685.1 transcriptional regulator, LysR family [Herpetosiphon aurantiacus DSM 785]HBW49561.1 LysR family transcriptional regulator [Herpetosiphon sp.]
MEIHQLLYFVAVAETGGFSRAAQRCAVSQPSLSQQIIKLEHELGQALFERLGRTIRLTTAGQALLPQAQQLLTQWRSIKQHVSDSVEQHACRLAIGIIPTLAPRFFPNVSQAFQHHFPRTTLSIVEHTTSQLLIQLIEYSLDLLIASGPIEHPLIQIEPLFDEVLLVALPHDHQYAQRSVLQLNDLYHMPLLALHDDHCLSQQVDAFCYEQYLEPQVVGRVTNLTTIQRCVAAGLGMAFVPQSLTQAEPHPNVVYRRLLDAQPQRKIIAAWHHQRPPSSSVLDLLRTNLGASQKAEVKRQKS